MPLTEAQQDIEENLFIFTQLFRFASVCPSVCLVVWLSGCLSVWLSGCLVVWLSGCLFVWLSGCLVVWLSVCLFVCLSVCCLLFVVDLMVVMHLVDVVVAAVTVVDIVAAMAGNVDVGGMTWYCSCVAIAVDSYVVMVMVAVVDVLWSCCYMYCGIGIGRWIFFVLL